MAFKLAPILFLCSLASLVSGQGKWMWIANFSDYSIEGLLKDCTLGQVRLVADGCSLIEENTGIVQICDSQHNWKRVCYYWGWKDSPYAHNLVCSQLGYDDNGIHCKFLTRSLYWTCTLLGAVSVRFSTSQTSTETEVSCMGNEAIVANCSLSMRGCSWHARLTCRKGIAKRAINRFYASQKNFCYLANCTNGNIRLVGGPSNREGRVEVCMDGCWGTVCGERWGDTEAGLVCARLGFPAEGKF